MHGCKIEDSPVSLKEAVKKGDESGMLFRNPKDYEGWTDEEKAKATLKMKSYWEGWAGKSTIMAQPGRMK